MPEYLEADFPVCSPGHLHSSHYQEIFEDFNKNLWSFSNLVSNHCFPELLSQWKFCYTNMVAFWIHPIFLHIFPHGACSCNPFCLFVFSVLERRYMNFSSFQIFPTSFQIFPTSKQQNISSKSLIGGVKSCSVEMRRP